MKYKIRKNLTFKQGNKKLYRIEALRDFSDIRKGDLGGYIESEANLSQYDVGWIYDNAKVSGNAQVSGNARVRDNAQVYDSALVYGNAQVRGHAQVSGYAQVSDSALVSDNALVYGNAQVCGDARVSSNAQVSSNALVNNSMIISSNKDLICISGIKYDITLSLTGINIGCKHYKDLNDFMSRVEEEANRNGYDEIEKKHLIAIIRNGIKLLKSYK